MTTEGSGAGHTRHAENTPQETAPATTTTAEPVKAAAGTSSSTEEIGTGTDGQINKPANWTNT